MVAATSETVTVAVNDEFTITLTATPSTGYLWEVQTIPEGVQLLTHDVAQQATPLPPGSPTVQVFPFKAVSAGEFRIVLILKRSWEGGAAASHTVEVKVK